MARRQTQGEFINIANLAHNCKYDYSKVCYINNNTYVIIICPIHGEFKQKPRSHSIEKKGCPQCGILSRYLSNEEFINSANKIHNYKYDYSKTKYTHSWNLIIIICKKHGEFKQKAAGHLIAQECCEKCYLEKRASNINEFIIKANLIHKNLYDYTQADYKTAHIKINIICKLHGNFMQTPNSHLGGHGCPCCGRGPNSSKKEIQWLDFLKIDKKYRQQTIKINNKKYKVDAYVPKTNTIYEFYGDYWHGNPKIFHPLDLNPSSKETFGKLYKNTLKREKVFKKYGFKLITIWEEDFLL